MPNPLRLFIFLGLLFGCLPSFSYANDSNTNLSKSPVARLRCFVSYADHTEIIDTFPQASGYDVKPINIGGRFTFKAVMIGELAHIDHIALYAYFQASPKDLPIHEAIYRGPFKLSKQATSLTPYNHLYTGDVERELKYHCELSKVKQ